MTTEEHAQFRQQARLTPQPAGLLGKMLAFMLSAALLVLGFMFSLVALAVVAVGGLALGGWLWWKTRRLRKQLREAATAKADDGYVIEGEVIRDYEAPAPAGRLLR